MWLFSKFHLIQFLVPDVYYAKTLIPLLIWRNRVHLLTGIECGTARSNFSPCNVKISLLGVPKRNHVTGKWRKLLRNLYSSTGHVARMGQGRVVYKILVEKPERKRPLGRPRCRREDGIRIYLRDTGRGRGELDSTS
jgi:hypothetical protein